MALSRLACATGYVRNANLPRQMLRLREQLMRLWRWQGLKYLNRCSSVKVQPARPKAGAMALVVRKPEVPRRKVFRGGIAAGGRHHAGRLRVKSLRQGRPYAEAYVSSGKWRLLLINCRYSRSTMRQNALQNHEAEAQAEACSCQSGNSPQTVAGSRPGRCATIDRLKLDFNDR